MKFTVDQFISFTTPLEGKVDTMYVDAKGLITVGFGNLIGTRKYGEGLKWVRRSDGSRATVTEYDEEFDLLSSKAESLAKDGWRAAEKLCKLRLTDESMMRLVTDKLLSNEAQLKIGFPDYDNMPADGQLFLHSMAWACGPSFWVAGPPGRYPVLRKTLNSAKDDPVFWVLAMSQCDINPKIGTIVTRNSINKILLWNAHFQGDLFYPGIRANIKVVAGDFYVGLLQQLMNRKPFNPNLKEDGVMGPRTKDAVRLFQRSAGLQQDGIVGPKTLAALLT